MQKKNYYDHQAVERQWQKKWERVKIYSPDLEKAKKPFYNLMMFPYPSAEGLHVGNTYAFIGADIYARFMRMQGQDVFEPIGLDGFGIHSENYALKVGEHPMSLAKKTKERFYKQLHAIGNSFDWTKTLETYDPEYYKWTQWIFVKMFKSGLAYRKKASVNWCPSCKTVLADEQVIAGNCERCRSLVTPKELSQWFFRQATGVRPNGISYPDALLTNLESLDWSESVKVAQKNWIGRSEGALIEFKMNSPLRGQNSKLEIEVFTTRPDTLYGVTFLAISPQSKYIGKILNLAPKQYIQSVSQYAKNHTFKGGSLQGAAQKNKTGIFTGVYAVNPATNEEIPVWVADYVLMEYGTGAIMGVPAHDERDMEFAKKFDIKVADISPDKSLWQRIEKEGWGRPHTNYHLRDWLISRQRYWGPPIPMIFCERCKQDNKSWLTSPDGQGSSLSMPDWDLAGWYPVPEEDLPVELPYIKDYQPRGKGISPLALDTEFYKVVCPGCGEEARRETDVSDTFLDSAWYYLRYPSVDSERWRVNSGNSNNKSKHRTPYTVHRTLPWDPEITRRWLPVNMYIGGAEHSVLHLLYARFLAMVFNDWGLTDFEEPFSRFYAHGLLIKESAKMSKSRGNIVVPDEYISNYGADTLRVYLMFLGPFDAGGDFRDTGILGMKRFLNRVWDLYIEHKDVILHDEKDAKQITIKMHQTIKKVTIDIQNLRYNTAISAIMEFVNVLRTSIKNSKLKIQNDNPKTKIYKDQSPITNHQSPIRCAEWDEALEVLAKLLAPFVPHLAEEVWVNVLGKKFSIHKFEWPEFVPELVKEDSVTIVVQVDGKFRTTLTLENQESLPADATRQQSSSLGGLQAGRIRAKVVNLAKSDPKLKKWLSGKKIKNTVFVPGKLVNFVTK